jgi:ATP-dependent Clp protease ATP-binding subunit ClpA
VDVELRLLQQSIFDRHGANSFLISASNPAKEFLLREGTDVKYGARPLRRAISRLLINPIANLIATNQIKAGDTLIIDLENDRLFFEREPVSSNWRVPDACAATAAAMSCV